VVSVVAIGDKNNEYMFDIVIGNWGWRNQLPINNGDGTFSEEVVDLPGCASYVESVGIADIMNDDCLIDRVVGNWGQKNNQLLINTGA
jgi:hypothetical protein